MFDSARQKRAMATYMLASESNTEEYFLTQPFRFVTRRHAVNETCSDPSNIDSDNDEVSVIHGDDSHNGHARNDVFSEVDDLE